MTNTVRRTREQGRDGKTWVIEAGTDKQTSGYGATLTRGGVGARAESIFGHPALSSDPQIDFHPLILPFHCRAHLQLRL